MASKRKELLKIEGVYIHEATPEANEDVHIAGIVYLWEQIEGIFLEWKPSPEESSKSKETEWTIVSNKVSYTNDKEDPDNLVVQVKTDKPTQHKHIINFDIKDLKSFRKCKSSGWSYLIFILKCGTTYPALHFHTSGSTQVTAKLQEYLTVNRSPQDKCLYLVREHDPQALSKSLDELNLFAGNREQAGDIIGKFMADPYTATIGGFSKVTNFLRDNFLVLPPMMDISQTEPLGYSNGILEMDLVEGIAINPDGEAGFEVITTQRELPPRPSVNRSTPVTSQLWSSYMDNEGRVTDVDAAKEAIFKGGVDSTIRPEVWKFLLGYYKWNSTYKSRTEQRKQKVDDYFRMKLQWKAFSAEQESRFSELRDHKSLVDKDVLRTDRTLKFFEGDNNPNISVLYDILLTHCMYNFDLGYVQGMSDLLAPILVVMENEVDAFWCFAGLVQMMGNNFEKDQQAMKNQLLQLQTLITFLDPQLANYLESHDSINMYFCFRWLLIIFKREFTFPDIMRLWEVIWTGRPCKNFHLLLCLAILDTVKTTLMENNFGFNEILKLATFRSSSKIHYCYKASKAQHINDLSCQIEVQEILLIAEGMFLQLRDCRDLPEQIHNILGMSSGVDGCPFQPFQPCNASMTPEDSCKRSPERSIAATPDAMVTQSLHSAQANSTEKVISREVTNLATTPDDSSIEVLSDI